MDPLSDVTATRTNSIVWRSTSEEGRESVSLKFLPEPAAKNDRLLERFPGEVRVARLIAIHPGIGAGLECLERSRRIFKFFPDTVDKRLGVRPFVGRAKFCSIPRRFCSLIPRFYS